MPWKDDEYPYTTPDFAGQNHHLLGLQHYFWETVSGITFNELQHAKHKNEEQFPNDKKENKAWLFDFLVAYSNSKEPSSCLMLRSVQP